MPVFQIRLAFILHKFYKKITNMENKTNINEENELNEGSLNNDASNTEEVANKVEAEASESNSRDNQDEQSSETDVENDESAGEPTTEELLDKANSEIAEYKDKYLRLMAEFDNYRKRVMKEKTELILNGGEKVITALLPVLDDFDRAEQNIKADEVSGQSSTTEGIVLIIDKLRGVLSKNGLKRIDPVGEPFDVDYHEAIAMVPGNPEELKNKVIDCVQPGYQLNDKVIRHAKVAVAE